MKSRIPHTNLELSLMRQVRDWKRRAKAQGERADLAIAEFGASINRVEAERDEAIERAADESAMVVEVTDLLNAERETVERLEAELAKVTSERDMAQSTGSLLDEERRRLLSIVEALVNR